MTEPLHPVDSAVVDSWFHEGLSEPSPEAYDALRSHRELYKYLVKAVLRDVPPSFDRDRALQHLREAWHWSASCLLRLDPLPPLS